MLAHTTRPDISNTLRAYRSRRNRPCDYCRKRKTRCDMVAPGVCAKCQKYGGTCTFVDQPAKKKRGVKLDKLDGPESQYTYSSNTTSDLSDSKKIGGGTSSNSTSDGEDSSALNGYRMSPSPPKSGSRSYVGSPSTDDTDVEPPLLPAGLGGISLVGLSGDQDPNLLRYYKYDENHSISFIKSAVRQVTDDADFPVQFLAFADERGSAYKTHIQAQLEKLQRMAGKYEERLLSLYFRFIHPLYPIIDKASFYRSYRHSPNSVDPGLLAGLLALSCAWWKYDTVLCVNPMPFGLATALYEECEISLHRDYKYPTLSTIQASLLLLQRRLALDQTALTFSVTADLAKLIALAHNLGLHLDCTTWSIPASEKKLRHKLWATLFIMEKWLTANTGRPSMLSWANSTWGVYSSDDPADQLFVQLNRLTVILDTVCQELYSVRSHVERVRDQVSTQQRVTELLRVLRAWHQALPEDIRDMKQSRGHGEYHRNGTIHLAALTIEVLLFKIRLSPAAFKLNEYRYYRQQGAEVIQRVIKFTSEISHSHLTGFWYASARMSFSTIAHFVFYYHATSLTTAEHRDTKEFIRKWLWALKILSQGWEEGTGLAKSKLEAVFWMGEGLFSDKAPAPTDLNNKLCEPNHTGTPLPSNVTSDNEDSGLRYTSPGLPFDIDSISDQYQEEDEEDSLMMELHTDWMNDDDMVLLNEDIMPQEEQVNQLLAKIDLPDGAGAEKWASYFEENFITGMN